jgi:T-complex protein 1 subunit gamma
MFNKDVVVPGRMRRRIPNPRVLLLDCPLEYKKAESQTNVEISREEDWWGGGGGECSGLFV